MGTRDILDRIVGRIGDVGIPVGWDPLAVVPPCVLVGVPEGVGVATVQRGWRVNVPVFIIGPRSWDRFDMDRLLATLDLILDRLRAGTWQWQSYPASPDLPFPAVRITVTGTLTLTEETP